MAGGDAKLSGVAVEMDEEGKRAYEEHASPPEPYHLFRLDLHEVVLTSLHPEGDRMVIETWRPDRPLQRFERR
jgi:hypothetical protein